MALKRLFVIDKMALAYRCFYAFGRVGLATADGTPTGAVYGTALALSKLLSEEKPDYAVVATDLRQPTFRHELYKDYKATRQKMPEDLSRQLSWIDQLISALGLPQIGVAGFEADDVIGTLAHQAAGPDTMVYIVSGDKDFYQLVSDRVHLYVPRKGEPATIVDAEGVMAKFQCRPDQVIDCLAIMGDSSDNVPGVKGIGEKGAAKLIANFGSLDAIYERLDEVTAKRQHTSLSEYKDQAYLSRQLVTIRKDVPIPEDWHTYVCDWEKATNNADLLGLYEQLEFTSLAKSLGGTPSKEAAPELEVQEIVDWQDAAYASTWQEAAKATQVAFDLGEGQLEMAIAGGSAVRYIWTGSLPEGIAGEMACLLSSRTCQVVVHGGKGFLRRLSPQESVESLVDTRILDYLLEPNVNAHDLASCCQRYLGRMAGFAPADILELADIMTPQVEARGMGRVRDEVEIPLIPVLVEMERRGVFIDRPHLEAFSHELETRVVSLREEIYREAGREFNINSPKQLQELLFEELKVHEMLGVKRLKRTKTGFSTDESVLQRLSAHPLPQRILEYRSVFKLKSTYVDALPAAVDPRTGRLHTTFRQTVAATGRLSSEAPNLQNIPMRTAMGQEIRRAFRPEEDGWVMLSADYSQVEIRLLAHMAEEQTLIAAFKDGLDIHRATAAKIFGKSPEDVDASLRSRAKAVNFGILYGMGPQRLAQQIGVTLPEAKEFIKLYFDAFPGIRQMTRDLIDKARDLGYAETLLGRRRPVPQLHDKNRAVLAHGENIAVNAPIQGTAADIIKIAMINIHRDLLQTAFQGRMLLQIHDELLFECPQTEAEALGEFVRERMENAFVASVPMKVDVGHGRTWLDAH